MNMMIKKAVAFLSAFALCTFVAGCSQAEKKSEETNQTKIYVISKSQDSYWEAVRTACEDVEAENKEISVTYTAPKTEDAESQKNLIQQAVTDGAEVIIFAPVLAEGYEEVLQQADEKNILLFTIDSDVNYSNIQCSLKTDNYAAAYLAGTKANEFLAETEAVGIVAHSLDTDNATAQARLTGFADQLQGIVTDKSGHYMPFEKKNEISGNSENNGSHELVIEDGAGDAEISKEAAKKIIHENPELKVLYGTNQPSTIGICSAVDEMVRSGEITADDIQVVGFDFFDGAEAYIESGVLDGCVIQNPYNMGYLSLQYAVSALQQKEIPEEMDTGAYLVTKENLHDANIQFVINPA